MSTSPFPGRYAGSPDLSSGNLLMAIRVVIAAGLLVGVARALLASVWLALGDRRLSARYRDPVGLNNDPLSHVTHFRLTRRSVEGYASDAVRTAGMGWRNFSKSGGELRNFVNNPGCPR